jgi:arylsulfatase
MPRKLSPKARKKRASNPKDHARAPGAPGIREGAQPSGDRHLLVAGKDRANENPVLNLKNKSYALTAEIDVPESGAEGVIIAQGGLTGGWSVYAKGGRPRYCYNCYGFDEYVVEGGALPPGTHRLRVEFSYDGGGVGRGGSVTFFVDGEQAGEGRVERTEAITADQRLDIGNDFGSPVTRDYGRVEFNGAVRWVEVDVGLDDHSYMIPPEERLILAMSR